MLTEELVRREQCAGNRASQQPSRRQSPTPKRQCVPRSTVLFFEFAHSLFERGNRLRELLLFVCRHGAPGRTTKDPHFSQSPRASRAVQETAQFPVRFLLGVGRPVAAVLRKPAFGYPAEIRLIRDAAVHQHNDQHHDDPRDNNPHHRISAGGRRSLRTKWLAARPRVLR